MNGRPPRPSRGWHVMLVAALLTLHAALCLSALLRKSHTSDEVLFLAAGVSYWKLDDYRLGSEAGHLPQRWATLPLLLMDDVGFPSGSGAWAAGDVWTVGHEFLYETGNDLDSILLAARSMIVALSVLLGLGVYHVSSRLFGIAGGVVSLSLYCLCPSVLAHAGLVTSDLMAAAAFFASTTTLWWLLARVTPLRVALAALAFAGLLLSKMSALLLLPLGALLGLMRLLDGRPLPVRLFGLRTRLVTRRSQIALLGALAVVHGLVAVTLIWTCFGFRHSAVPRGIAGEERFEQRFEAVRNGGGAAVQAVGGLSDRHLLPEAYLYGLAYQLDTSNARRAFAAGRYSLTGWSWFFPYAVAIKTPLATLGVLLLAAAAVAQRLRRLPRARVSSAVRRGLYRTAPLWTFIAFYWIYAVGSKLNIGHRHILPVYIPTFVLAGAAGYWLERGGRASRAAIVGLLVALALTSVRTWPDYLAYFNLAAGGPENGHRHLVDSSLDWGQDLPALAEWIERGRGRGTFTPPLYLAYFGNALPAHYGVEAVLLPGVPDRRPPGVPVDLGGGTYAISASLLQSALQLPMGPWCDVYEELYREEGAALERWKAADDVGRRRIEAGSGVSWAERMRRFEELRLARLCAWLRKRHPDGNAGHSILIYRLSDEQVREALEGPPAELAHGIQVER